ncbi:hypothetical protein GCM10027577_12520 [Spirosoma fluminis]
MYRHRRPSAIGHGYNGPWLNNDNPRIGYNHNTRLRHNHDTGLGHNYYARHRGSECRLH